MDPFAGESRSAAKDGDDIQDAVEDRDFAILPIADFLLLDVARNDERSLSEVLSCSDTLGSIVVFWSAICSHCRFYDGFLNDFAIRWPQLRLGVIGCRQGESTENLGSAAAERCLNFPLFDDVRGELATAWGVQQTPTAFLLNGENQAVYRGAIDNFTAREDPCHRPFLQDAVESFIDGKKVKLFSTPSFGCPTSSVYYDMPLQFGTKDRRSAPSPEHEQ